MSASTAPITDAAPETMSSILRSGELDGYQARQPQPFAAEIDAEVCRDSTCTHCGTRGLGYRPFIRERDGRRSYRAFAVCPSCGLAEEF